MKQRNRPQNLSATVFVFERVRAPYITHCVYLDQAKHYLSEPAWHHVATLDPAYWLEWLMNHPDERASHIEKLCHVKTPEQQIKLGRRKFSEWCDEIKSNHAFCVDAEISYEKFITDLFVIHFLNTRGCSMATARLHAIDFLAAEQRTRPSESVGRENAEAISAPSPGNQSETNDAIEYSGRTTKFLCLETSAKGCAAFNYVQTHRFQ